MVVLHGGANRPGAPAVRPTQLSVLRMVPIAWGVRRAARGRLAVYRLLNSSRGWDTTQSPVDDVHWALARIDEMLGERLPVALIGHSLGGRAALLAASRPEVVAAVALAPWVYPEDVAPGIAGTRVLIVHGDRDRVAAPARAQALARRLAAVTDVEFLVVRGGRHAMLRHARDFTRPAIRFAVDALLTAPSTVLSG